MPLDILYFASVREAMGVAAERVDLSAPVATVGDLADWIAARDSRGAAAFADRARLRAARDGALVGWSAPVAGASEIAFFPPVTGG